MGLSGEMMLKWMMLKWGLWLFWSLRASVAGAVAASGTSKVPEGELGRVPLACEVLVGVSTSIT